MYLVFVVCKLLSVFIVCEDSSMICGATDISTF